MKKLLLFLVFVLAWAPAWAQNTTVTGRVLGGNGSAQPGVTVLQKGTNNGTSTDNDGIIAFRCHLMPCSTVFRPLARPLSKST